MDDLCLLLPLNQLQQALLLYTLNSHLLKSLLLDSIMHAFAITYTHSFANVFFVALSLVIVISTGGSTYFIACAIMADCFIVYCTLGNTFLFFYPC